MSVRIQHGIGYSKRSGARYIDMSAEKGEDLPSPARKIKSPQPEDETLTREYVNWGEDNGLPMRMASDIESCGVLNSGIDSKARFAIGRGISPVYVKMNKDGSEEITDVVQDAEITDFLEMNNEFFHSYGWMRDFYGFGNGCGRIMLTRDRKKIARFQRDDITEMRYEKMNSRGEIKNLFLSAQWDIVNSVDEKDKVIKIPMLNQHNMLFDLNNRTSGKEFAFSFRYPAWNRKYYSMPLWYAAYKWVKIAQGVPDMKAAMFENNIRLKYIVVIYEDYWTETFGMEWNNYTEKEKEERRSKVFNEIDDYLVGSNNSYKSIFTAGRYDSISQTFRSNIEIKPIEDNTIQGDLLPDSAAANSEILFAMMINPAIIGASLPSGPYTNNTGGSNIREATLVQIMIQEFERRQISRILNMIKYYNDWDRKIQFRYLGNVMTTLDTGSSGKSIISGGNNQPSEGNTEEES